MPLHHLRLTGEVVCSKFWFLLAVSVDNQLKYSLRWNLREIQLGKIPVGSTSVSGNNPCKPAEISIAETVNRPLFFPFD